MQERIFILLFLASCLRFGARERVLDTIRDIGRASQAVSSTWPSTADEVPYGTLRRTVSPVFHSEGDELKDLTPLKKTMIKRLYCISSKSKTMSG